MREVILTRQLLIQLIRPDGRFVLMGVSTTELFTISPEILFKRARIRGSTQIIDSINMGH
ncbi:MAG TPA: hypothetical protein VE643_09660 [Nitrososphaeraceae archaeon]|nr:hypothetical protein [Nitrososphaeraceae archaeon]